MTVNPCNESYYLATFRISISWSMELQDHLFTRIGISILIKTSLWHPCYNYKMERSVLVLHSTVCLPTCAFGSLRWRHNGHDIASNHQPHGCLLNRLFRRRSRKRSKLRVTGLCVGNSPGTGEFPAQMASNAENVPIWLPHHDVCVFLYRCSLCLHSNSGFVKWLETWHTPSWCWEEEQ